MNRHKLTVLKAAISIAAASAVVGRLIWPDLRFDTVSLGLFVLIALPWLSGLFDTLEFPGGWKISFRDLEVAAKVFPATEKSSEGVGGTKLPSYLEVRGLDPELALVGLRIEIEKRLQDLADHHGLLDGKQRGVSQLTRTLQHSGVIPANIGGALTEVVIAGNAAAHGQSCLRVSRILRFLRGPRFLHGSIERSPLPRLSSGDSPKNRPKKLLGVG